MLGTLALVVVIPLFAFVLAFFFWLLAWLHTKSSKVPRFSNDWHQWATVISSFLALAASFQLVVEVVGGGPLTQTISKSLGGNIYDITFRVDALSCYFILLVNTVVFFSSLYLRAYLTAQPHGRTAGYFYTLFNLFHLAMVLVPAVDNLVWIWIFLELTTLFSAGLVAFRNDRAALEAAWKYLIITSTGIIFALVGTLFLASALHVTMDWSQLIAGEQTVAGDNLGHWLVRLSFLFVLVGYGAKAGLAPMHTWLPDGHGEAPYPISALLSGVLLKSALYAILRFYTITNLALDDGGKFTSLFLLGAGVLSLLIAIPFIIKENPFKRVLAYHSLEHMGIIVFGIGLGTPAALFGALLHALNHAFTKALMFLSFGQVQAAHGFAREAEPYRGLFRTLPYQSIFLIAGGLGLVGAPLFNIFFSELIILRAAFDLLSARNDWLLLAIILFVVSIFLIFAGLTRHLGQMIIGEPPANADQVSDKGWRLNLPVILLLLIVIIFGLTVPKVWAFDLPLLLQQSVDIVRCGAVTCR